MRLLSISISFCCSIPSLFFTDWNRSWWHFKLFLRIRMKKNNLLLHSRQRMQRYECIRAIVLIVWMFWYRCAIIIMLRVTIKTLNSLNSCEREVCNYKLSSLQICAYSLRLTIFFLFNSNTRLQGVVIRFRYIETD